MKMMMIMGMMLLIWGLSEKDLSDDDYHDDDHEDDVANWAV